MATRKRTSTAKQTAGPKWKFICVDEDGTSAIGETAIMAFEKYKSDCGCYEIAELDFYEVSTRFKGVESVILTPAMTSNG